MIHFNRAEFNLDAIRRAAGLHPEMSSKYRYWVYGLKNHSPEHPNPAIEIEIGAHVNGPVGRTRDWLISNGISCKATHAKKNYPGYTDYTIYLGLRRDVREHVTFAACMVETLVYALEEMMVLDSAFRIPNVPKLLEPLVAKKVETTAKSASLTLDAISQILAQPTF